MAAADLTTLANLKLWLPLKSDNTADDVSLARLITAVSQDFMRAIRRPELLKATYTEVHLGDGASRMTVFHWPIVAVSALRIATINIPLSADKIAAGYWWDADIDPERNWQLYLNGQAFTDRALVQLNYAAGYLQPGGTPAGGDVALPEDIEQAVIDWCGYRYKERPNVAAVQRKASTGEAAQTPLIDAPPNVLSVIERYKRPVPSVDRRGDERGDRVNMAAKRAGR